MTDTLNPPKQPPVALTLSDDVSNRLRGAARLCGVSPEVLADRILTAAVARAAHALTGTAENQPVVLAGFVGKAFRDIKRLMAPKLLPPGYRPQVDPDPDGTAPDAASDKETDK